MAPKGSRYLNDGKVGRLPAMPAEPSGKIVSFQDSYTTKFVVPNGRHGILTVAPYGYVLGIFQTCSQSDGTGTSVTGIPIIPPFAKSLVTTANLSSTLPVSVRCSGVCTSITNVSALATINGSAYFRRMQGAVPVNYAGTASDANFQAYANAITNDAHSLPCASLTSAKCVQSLVNDTDGTRFHELSSLDATNDATMVTAWRATYLQPTISPTDDKPTCPWSPNAVYFDNSAGAGDMIVVVTLEYCVQVLAAPQTFLSVIASPVPHGLPHEYLKVSASYFEKGWEMAKGPMDRDPRPYLGVNSGHKREAQPQRKGKNGNLRGSQPKQSANPRPGKSANNTARNSMAGGLAGGIAALALPQRGKGAIRSAVRDAVLGLGRRGRRFEL